MLNHEIFRPFGFPFSGTHSSYGFGHPGFTGTYPTYSPWPLSFYPHGATSQAGLPSGMPSMTAADMGMLRERLDAIQAQLAYLTECYRRGSEFAGGRSSSTHGTSGHGGSWYAPFPGNSYVHPTPGFEMSEGARLRESDSLIFWEIFLPKLSLNDVDVEVSGNRIVCRTRVPLHATDRFWNFSTTQRGFEVYELPDGRAEFNWTVPVRFEAKEVEATFREGFLCICIPKCDHAERQTVQVTKETGSSRKSTTAHQTHVS